ncbi:MAG: hypothetical protein AAF266_02315 [Planctomycetota bacterium]
MMSCSKRLVLSMACVALVGCGYGKVSPQAYEHAKAIYTLANMKAAAAIDETEAAITADAKAGLITEEEAGWLTDLCDECRAGDWESAQSSARRMMDEQAER